MNQNLGKYIILVGAVIVMAGILIYFFWDKLAWLGKLPGDISYQKGNTKIFFPVVTMILVSVLLNLLLYLIRRFF